METCVFCRIAVGREERSLIYEDDICYVIVDIRPVTPGHSMVIPKAHAAYLRELDDATWAHVCLIAKRLERALAQSGLRCEGTNLFLADGEAAFQEVFHLHLHVFPRYKGDAFQLVADWSNHPPRAELDAVASKIRASWADA